MHCLELCVAIELCNAMQTVTFCTCTYTGRTCKIVGGACRGSANAVELTCHSAVVDTILLNKPVVPTDCYVF